MTAKLKISNEPRGKYAIRIVRDRGNWPDKFVTQTDPFDYDGGELTKDLPSFTAKYATGEGHTQGYHVDLLKKNLWWHKVWTSENLKVCPNRDDKDGWYDTGRRRWVDDPDNPCKEKEQKRKETTIARMGVVNSIPPKRGGWIRGRRRTSPMERIVVRIITMIGFITAPAIR